MLLKPKGGRSGPHPVSGVSTSGEGLACLTVRAWSQEKQVGAERENVLLGKCLQYLGAPGAKGLVPTPAENVGSQGWHSLCWGLWVI